VELARALALELKVLLLDEPTRRNESEELVQMMEIIRRVHHELVGDRSDRTPDEGGHGSV
jgi:ABC-type branched-subunit amino acid transport system ATPase component